MGNFILELTTTLLKMMKMFLRKVIKIILILLFLLSLILPVILLLVVIGIGALSWYRLHNLSQNVFF